MINYDITLDFSNTAILKTPYKIKQRDNDSIQFSIHLSEEIPKDGTIVLRFLFENGSTHETDCFKTSNLTDNTFVYILKSNDLAISGKTIAEVSVYGKDAQRLTSTSFSFNIIPDINTDKNAQDNDKFPLLLSLINTVSALSLKITNNLNSINKHAENYDKLLSTMKSEINFMSGRITDWNDKQAKLDIYISTLNDLESSLNMSYSKFDTSYESVNILIKEANALIKWLREAAQKGEFDGVSGVYVGSETMPDGYNVQIDPDGTPASVSDIAKQAADMFNNTDVQGYINDYLDAHPEATTSVLDGSISYEKLAPGIVNYVTPQMYGAKADGVTDDSGAIQAAIDTGKRVYIPSGVYLCKSPVGISANNLYIHGNNSFSDKNTLLVFENSDGFVFTNARFVTIDGVSVSTVDITQSGYSFTENSYCAFRFKGNDAHKVRILNAYIHGFKYGITAASVDDDDNTNLWNCQFKHIRTNNVEYGLCLSMLSQDASDKSKYNNHFGIVLEDVLFDNAKIDVRHSKVLFIACNVGIHSPNAILCTHSSYCNFINCNFECDDFIDSIIGEDGNPTYQYIFDLGGKEYIFTNCSFTVRGGEGVCFFRVHSFTNLVKFDNCWTWTPELFNADGVDTNVATYWHTGGNDVSRAGTIRINGYGMKDDLPTFGFSGYQYGCSVVNPDISYLELSDEFIFEIPDKTAYYSTDREQMETYDKGVKYDFYGNKIAEVYKDEKNIHHTLCDDFRKYPIKIGRGFYIDGGEVEVTGDTVNITYNKTTDGNIMISPPPLDNNNNPLIVNIISSSSEGCSLSIKMWDADNKEWQPNTHTFTLKWTKISL